MSKPTFGGLVRSNFWKGRQRLNRLYRWIANVVRPKIDNGILCEAGFQNNPEVHDFLNRARAPQGCPCGEMILSRTVSCAVAVARFRGRPERA